MKITEHGLSCQGHPQQTEKKSELQSLSAVARNFILGLEDCDGLDENGPHGLIYLSVCFPVSGTVR